MYYKDGIPDEFRTHLCNECADAVFVDELCPDCVSDFEQSDYFPISIPTPEQAREINRYEAGGTSFVRRLLNS